MPDRDLSFHEEVFHGHYAVTAFTLSCESGLSRLHSGAILAKAGYIGVLLLVPTVVGHVATLVAIDVGVTAGSVRVVVHCLYGCRALFRIVELSRGGRGELSKLCVASFGGRIHLGVTTVIETDVGIAATPICPVHAGLPSNIVAFA